MQKKLHTIQKAFINWQCRLRQMIVREREGKPDDSIMPSLTLDGGGEPLGCVVSLLNKHQDYSHVPEMMHIAKQTHDPAIRQDKALKLLCEYYYTRAHEFSDVITASFMPLSQSAQSIAQSAVATLHFEAYGQEFTLPCTPKKFSKNQYYYKATWWHNHLFNPQLSKDTIVIGFMPNWQNVISKPLIKG